MVKKAEVIIIGGGVIGTSIAYYLAVKGKKVMLIERNDLACGASGACDQNILLQSKSPGLLLHLALLSTQMYKFLEKELAYDLEYKQSGGMVLIETVEEYKIMEDFSQQQKQQGLQVEILDRKETLKLQQGLAEHVLGASYCPLEAHVNPINLTLAFAAAAHKLGAEIFLQTKVTDILHKNQIIKGVKTNRGEFAAPIVVNATGAWAPFIGKMLDLNIPIKPRKGQIAITEPVPPLIKTNINSARYIIGKLNPSLLKKTTNNTGQAKAGLSLTQTKKGNILIGATREFTGYNINTTGVAIKEILSNGVRLLPKLKDINLIRTMAGLRPYTPDGLPLLGPITSWQGFFMAAGHEGDGIALAPITGKILADLITEGKTFLDLKPLSPDRFI